MRAERRPIATAITQGCEAWRCGDDARGLESFQRAALLLLVELEQRREEPDDLPYTRLSAQLQQALTLMEAGDIAAALDVLETIVLPKLAAVEKGQQ
ncbi:hypothetical protein [Paenibacillus sp. SYP-B4298]|uniref:hypothetical protein n=1 Tax=Paenibacillus sp. SYP-B4298 TaxID=2996034 RepID=UPI0022DE63BA|nr:hypothetical protein [Paenibacillus sp. SYP-B4298]